MVSLVLMYVAAREGWLGPDVGRGDGFCEAARPGWLRQPANSLSNLGFVLAGLLIGWHARLPSGRLARPGLAASYAVVVVLLGPGSMAMHATQTELGGRLDQASMYLRRELRRRLRGEARHKVPERASSSTCFAACCCSARSWSRSGGGLPVVDNSGNLVFGVGAADRDGARGPPPSPRRRPR